jgi:hypothetical protein
VDRTSRRSFRPGFEALETRDCLTGSLMTGSLSNLVQPATTLKVQYWIEPDTQPVVSTLSNPWIDPEPEPIVRR